MALLKNPRNRVYHSYDACTLVLMRNRNHWKYSVCQILSGKEEIVWLDERSINSVLMLCSIFQTYACPILFPFCHNIHITGNDGGWGGRRYNKAQNWNNLQYLVKSCVALCSTFSKCRNQEDLNLSTQEISWEVKQALNNSMFQGSGISFISSYLYKIEWLK